MPTNAPNDIDVNELILELKKGFISELPERLDTMEGFILAMENQQNFNDNYENLYRQAHSLKGSAGTYGLHIITSICHALEDVLNEVGLNGERFNEYGGSYWLNYIDLIREVLTSIENNVTDLSAFEERLSQLQSVQPGGQRYQLHCMVVTSSNLYESLFPNFFANDNIKFSYSHNGYQALGRLLTEKVDIIISDHEVSMLNGLALFSALRLSDSKNRCTKTVLLTSTLQDDMATGFKPDFIVYKDESFTQNLAKTIRSVSTS